MKKYELTQEQIDKLAEKKHAKELLKEFLPEAFGNKLEVGKYYIHKIHNDLINIAEINEKDEIKFYGFEDYESENTIRFRDERKSPLFYGYGRDSNNLRLATEEEVREALINEAKKRGYKKGVKCKFGTSKEIRVIETNNFIFEFNSNKLYLRHSSGDNADEIFRNGFWAEIIEEKNTIDKDYLDNKITEIYSLLGDIKQYVKELDNEN